jgi:hypothetical protein
VVFFCFSSFFIASHIHRKVVYKCNERSFTMTPKRVILLCSLLFILSLSSLSAAPRVTMSDITINISGTDYTLGTSELSTFINSLTSNLSSFSDMSQAMSNASAISIPETSSLTSYMDYKVFSVSVGFGAGAQFPGNNLATIAETVMAFPGNGSTFFSIVPNPAVSGGIHLGAFSKKLRKLYIDFRVMYLPSIPYTLGNFALTAENITWGVGFTYNIIERKDLAGGVLGWGGLKVHTGYYGSYNKFTLRVALPTMNVDTGSDLNSANGNEYIVFTPDLNLTLNNNTHTIPVDLTTSFRLLWVLDIHLGVGINVNLGASSIDITQNSSIGVTDGNGGTSVNVTSGGNLVISDATQVVPTTFTAKLMTGIGIKIFPVIINIPISIQIPLLDTSKLAATAGVTVGVVF